MKDIGQLIELAERAALEAGYEIMRIYQSGKFETVLKPDDSPLTKADTKAHTIISRHLGKACLPLLSEEGAHLDFDTRKNWEYFWLIDPLDGTKEFINKNGEFTVNIALAGRNTLIGGVIYAPVSGILYSGSKQTGVYKKEQGRRIVFPPLTERVQMKDLLQRDHLNVVASRSHIGSATMNFINQFKNVTLTLSGSSLKFMQLLENRADIYPRLEPTMEWDTAAAHAILNASNRGVYQEDLLCELTYNKPDLHNPSFIAF
jgi:3'(2'), 5'-bisphosphate nucleotidase